MSLLAKAKKLRETRCQRMAEARKIVETAEKEGRAMRADEDGSWEEAMKEVDGLKERIDKLERMALADNHGEEDERDDEEEDKEGEEGDEERDDDTEDEEKGNEEDEEEEDGDRSHKPRFKIINGKRYMIAPKGKNRNRTAPGGKGLDRRHVGETETEYRTRQRRSSPEYRTVFFDYMLRGNAAVSTPLASRAIQADSDILGGYLVAPQEFTSQLIKFVNNYLFIRKYATTHTLKQAQSLGAPSLDADVADADWTSELDTGNEDTSMAFGKRELTPHPLAKRLKVSNRLLRMASISSGASADNSVKGGGPEGLVRDRLGYKFGVTEEKAFLLGNGVNQPLGVYTASTRGIDTSRDVVTGSSTGFTGDGLISAKFNQKVQYWPRLRWNFNRSALKLIRQLKDANGQYLWVPGGFGGEDDRLLDFPVDMSEYAPNTFTTGQYVGLLADWSFYWIADAEQLEIMRLVELYAAANQTGFIARMELDGMPVLAEAFTRLKCN